VIDEFIYQFNSFCSYRQRVAKASENEEEIQILRENPNTWGCYSVLNVLYSLIQRSQISEQLAAMKRGEDGSLYAGEYGNRPLYKMLGYFSIIGLLRVHCLLGDFSLALKTLDDIELNKKAMFARVMAAHFTTYYYIGFSYMMMRRYADAIRMFSHILIYVSRTKNFQKNAQYDSITKKNDQMYALIAICVAFNPTRLDDTIHTALREKYGEQFNRMQRGGPEALPIFEELFRSACPKFISPTPPDFDNPEINVDPIDYQCQIFMEEVKNNMMSPTVKSYLKLYTTMDLKKLAGFLEVEPEKLRSWLLVNKQRSRQVRWSEGGLLDGEITNSSDLDYALQGVRLFSDLQTLHLTNLTLGSHPRFGGQGRPEVGRLVPAQPCEDVLSSICGLAMARGWIGWCGLWWVAFSIGFPVRLAMGASKMRSSTLCLGILIHWDLRIRIYSFHYSTLDCPRRLIHHQDHPSGEKNIV
jgi:translation initiation factor 3 subunit L